MDELDLLRGFRDDVPSPSPAARRRACPAERTRARRPFLARRRGVLPVAVAALAVALLVTQLEPSGGGPALTGTALAAKQLRDAAAVVERQPDPRAIGPGQYWYQRSLRVHPSMNGARAGTCDGHCYWFVQPIVAETWIGRDGNGRVISTPVGEARFPQARDREQWQVAGSPPLGKPFDGPIEDLSGRAPGFDLGLVDLGTQRVRYEQLVALPTDPDALLARLKVAAARDERVVTPAVLFGIVENLLVRTPVPSQLRAALYRVAARIPGIYSIGQTTDAAGRQGVGVEFDQTSPRGFVLKTVLIFDPATGELLGERVGPTILSTGRVDPGITGNFDEDAFFLEQGVVDAIGRRP